MKNYDPKIIEKKWQKKWEKEGLYKAEDFSEKEKKYILIEFPYPSGAGLHVGHVRSYTALDVISRKLRMEGYNALYPIGWDAFGLPTENYAIKNKIHPRIATEQNIRVFTRQIKSLGISFDWDREIDTTDPNYYKWTQWIFLKLFENGLAYKSKIPINWCPSCKIGLANEEVVDGKCERCGAQTEKREKEQWMLAITKYADRLIDDLERVDYLEKIKTQQINWIGRKEWIDIDYPIEGIEEKIIVSTTRPDTNFGATFVVIAPEHNLLTKEKGIILKEYREEVDKYIENSLKKSELERISEGRKKTGVFTGLYCLNRLNNKKLPIWVSDFALTTVGTGAVVGVPGHDIRDFEFAKEFNIPIIRVVVGKDGDKSDIMNKEQVQEEEGSMVNSKFLDGLEIHEATKKIMDYLEEKGWGKRTMRYHLRDWVFSRQHYWGEPIPLVHCEHCGTVALPEDQLPLTLPDVEKYEPTDTGESPLANITEWVNTTCPKCGGVAKRETDTMPNWAGSSWYFLRYIDPKNENALADQEKLKYWMPVDLYNGGMEHTTLHLLYSRFWNKFLYDIGVVPFSEPYAKRVSHGMVLAEDGKKMSKSLGNVINPDDVIREFGADTLRTYEMFMGPYGEAIPWSTDGLKGVKKFLDKVWGLQKKLGRVFKPDMAINRLLHKTVKKVTEDIENFKFNTAISAMMILANEMEKAPEIALDGYKLFILILSPFAPHMCEEIWNKIKNQKSKIKNLESIFTQLWPSYDPNLAKDEEIELVVQVNGKVRDKFTTDANISEEYAKKQALESEKVAEWIKGKEVIKVIFVKGRLVNIVIR
ncbi:MAG: leucine--tRNA ligase [bacterium]